MGWERDGGKEGERLICIARKEKRKETVSCTRPTHTTQESGRGQERDKEQLAT